MRANGVVARLPILLCNPVESDIGFHLIMNYHQEIIISRAVRKQNTCDHPQFLLLSFNSWYADSQWSIVIISGVYL